MLGLFGSMPESPNQGVFPHRLKATVGCRAYMVNLTSSYVTVHYYLITLYVIVRVRKFWAGVV